MDYWNMVMDDLRPLLTIIDPQRSEYLTALNRSRIPYEIVHHNYQKVVDAERAQIELSSRAGLKDDNFDYENSYHTYNEIVAQFQFLSSKCKCC